MRAMFLALALLIPATALAPSSPRAQTCTPAWDTSIGNTGMNNRVLSFAVHDEGSGPSLFAAGLFTTAGGVTANRIARWDASAWSAVGTGLGNQTLSLQAFDDGSGAALYAGGGLVTAGGGSALRVAHWNGASWSAVGAGTNSRVRALEVFNDGSGSVLYAGGLFSTAGGVSASHVARWNGSAWSALGGTFSGGSEVYALRGHDDGTGPALYVGGQFSTLDGATANNIVRWTGCASDTPALSGWGGALLALLLAGGGAIRVARRRRGTASGR